MGAEMLTGQPVRQIAYYVDDIRAAAARHVATFGSGPFFVMDLPPLPAVYRGQPIVLDQPAAVGQWGHMQVELIQENGDGPSILHELYPRATGRYGLHHMAIFVDDLETAVTHCARQGLKEVMRVTPPGLDMSAVFIDAVATHGHFFELYEPIPALVALYAHVAAAAVDFDRSDPVRTIRLGN
jgi:hypothetical protein